MGRLQFTSLCFFALLLAITGCGGDQPVKEEAGSHGHPQKLKIFLGRHDAPPKNVARLVKYYMIGGPPGCRREDASSFALSYGISAMSRPEVIGDVSISEIHPHVGDNLMVCVLNPEGKVDLEAVPPHGRPETLHGPDYGVGITPLYVELYPWLGEGVWKFRARSGGQFASMQLKVLPPEVPAYRVISEENGSVKLLVVGLKPREPFFVRVYEPEDPPQAQTFPRAEYVTSRAEQANGNGMAIFSLELRGAKKETCYVAKVEVSGHILDDIENTLSVFCVGFS